jgi:hypothetical protein
MSPHRLNVRRDAWSDIDSSHVRQHEEELKRQEDYDRNHGSPWRGLWTRANQLLTWWCTHLHAERHTNNFRIYYNSRLTPLVLRELKLWHDIICTDITFLV